MNNKNLSDKERENLKKITASVNYITIKPEIQKSPDYFKLNREHGIVCSSGQGSNCWGSEMCNCKTGLSYEFTFGHIDYVCPNCSNISEPNNIPFHICRCCYSSCPNCKYNPDSQYNALYFM